MTSFLEDWEAAGQNDDYIDPPAGAYLARLTNGQAFSAKKTGANYVKLEWELLEGSLAGGRFEDFKGVDNKTGMSITRTKLITLGLEPGRVTTIDELHDAIKRLIGTEATISISHGGDDGQFLNIDVLDARTGGSDIPTDTPDEDLPSARGSFADLDDLDDGDAEEIGF